MNFGQLYLLHKINKQLSNVPTRPALSNCGTSTDKCSEVLENHLKKVMQKGWSSIKNSRYPRMPFF